MEIKMQHLKRCQLVTLSGLIDSAHAPELERTLLDLVRSGRKNIVLNVRGVELITSAGLKALMAAYIATRRAFPPGAIVLSECSPQLQATLDLVGFSHQFTAYEDDKTAVGSF